jgi:hypothetical protein
MFGYNKVIAIQKIHPKKYTYHLTTSDTISDQELLKLFDKSHHVKKWQKSTCLLNEIEVNKKSAAPFSKSTEGATLIKNRV